MTDLAIRAATRADVPQILAFIQELADYEKEPDAVVATAAMIEHSLFGDGANVHGLICEQAGAPVGFAIYFFSFSTWLGRSGIYLEDLYVRPESRGKGAGKALLRELARIAVARDCGRLEWAVLDWNTPAIQFYEALGARPQSEWTTYRVTGGALANLAAGH